MRGSRKEYKLYTVSGETAEQALKIHTALRESIGMEIDVVLGPLLQSDPDVIRDIVRRKELTVWVISLNGEAPDPARVSSIRRRTLATVQTLRLNLKGIISLTIPSAAT